MDDALTRDTVPVLHVPLLNVPLLNVPLLNVLLLTLPGKSDGLSILIAGSARDQKGALPGVLGNGMQSLMFSMPVI